MYLPIRPPILLTNKIVNIILEGSDFRFLWVYEKQMFGATIFLAKPIISMTNLIKIYRAVQELWAFSLKDLDWPKCCSANPRHHFAYQWLDNIKIN